MITRRSFALAPAAWLAARSAAADSSTTSAPIGAGFPAQPLEIVRDAVIAAHGNLDRLRALVDRQQTLAKATYDWGFGD